MTLAMHDRFFATLSAATLGGGGSRVLIGRVAGCTVRSVVTVDEAAPAPHTLLLQCCSLVQQQPGQCCSLVQQVRGGGLS
jgi:hypothetical protein